MVHPTLGMEIAEPVMPTSLPTPNSNNNGKVLVSNGSGYAINLIVVMYQYGLRI